MLSCGDKVLIAVSGGGDSVALLYSLLELKEDFSLTLYVAHINHNLRGTESQRDADFVQNLCRDLGIQLFNYSADVKAEVKKHGLSIEEAARKVRYNFLGEASKTCGAKKIAVGHNQNDNAETILLRLCRGTGITGLGGIPPVRETDNFTIIRPLIETDREDIESFLYNRGIQYCTDATNFDKDFSRNRIRHDVIPILQKVNPTVSMQLAKTALLLREEASLLDELTDAVYQKCIYQNQEESLIRLHIPTLSQSSNAMQKRVVRMGLLKAGGLRDISQTHISQIEKLLTNQTGKKIHLPGLLFVQREYDYLLISKLSEIPKKNNLSARIEPFCYNIILNEPIFIPALSSFVLATIIPEAELETDLNNLKADSKTDPKTINKKIPYTTSIVNSLEICTKYFNYDKIIGELCIRTRRPRDRIAIYTIGRSDTAEGYSAGSSNYVISNAIDSKKLIGNKKLKDEFCDRKIPRDKRDTIPLLALDNNILWIMDDSKKTSSSYAVQAGCKVLKVSILQQK